MFRFLVDIEHNNCLCFFLQKCANMHSQTHKVGTGATMYLAGQHAKKSQNAGNCWFESVVYLFYCFKEAFSSPKNLFLSCAVGL